ncbi:MAG TPA: PqqD family protein [Firmicutes bacterium]|nr:PqqD family protein [Bacillota bacterium]
MSRIKLTFIPVKNKEILFRKEKDKIIMLNENSGDPFYLENTGAFIWEKIDGERNINEIFGCIINSFEGDPKLIKAELFSFLQELEENRLIFLDSK